MLRKTTSQPPPDDYDGFRWWDYGVLTIFSAALVLFCGFLAVKVYGRTDPAVLESAFVDPQSLPTPICKFKLADSTARSLCYDVRN